MMEVFLTHTEVEHQVDYELRMFVIIIGVVMVDVIIVVLVVANAINIFYERFVCVFYIYIYIPLNLFLELCELAELGFNVHIRASCYITGLCV